MPGHADGTITGGMPEPKPDYLSLSLSLSLGKAAVRTLTDLLHRQYAGAGVHIATVAGAVAPGTRCGPDDIVEHYWRLHERPHPHREVTVG